MTENIWQAMMPAYEKWAEPTSSRLGGVALERAAPAPGSKLLDVDARTGGLAVLAARLGYRVQAVDPTPAMGQRLAERLAEFPGCAGEVMNSLDLTFADNTFEAAFSLLGALCYGEETPQALTQLFRVVRPGGVVSVVQWVDPIGAPIFRLVARAIDQLDDSAIGRFVPPLSGYLRRSEIELALSGAGGLDVRSELVEVESPVPAPEQFMDELDPIFAMHPQYRAAKERHGADFRALLTREATRLHQDGTPTAQANLGYARVAG
ncbi:MAG: methyltransferase domain-containing protein [Actinoplanes sp.]